MENSPLDKLNYHRSNSNQVKKSPSNTTGYSEIAKFIGEGFALTSFEAKAILEKNGYAPTTTLWDALGCKHMRGGVYSRFQRLTGVPIEFNKYKGINIMSDADLPGGMSGIEAAMRRIDRARGEETIDIIVELEKVIDKIAYQGN